MTERLEDIAKRFRFDKVDFERFAVRYNEKFGVTNNGWGLLNTTEVEKLVKAFQTQTIYKSTTTLLQPEDVWGYNVHGWTSDLTPEGTVIWSSPNAEGVVYATPHYNEEREVPFEISYPDGENIPLLNVILSEYHSLEYQLMLYKDALRIAIARVMK